MADISKITTLNGTTYNIKDLKAYRKGEDIRHKNSSISQDPQYVSLITNKMTSEEQQTIRAIAGVGDYFYALHLNPNYTVTCNYSGQHGTKGNFAISTLFSPSGSSTVLLDVDEIATKPFVLEIMKNSGVITATDVVNLELFTHTLGQSAARLTDYKVELYTTGSTANTGTFSWQTVYQRSNVSDSPSGLIICLNATSYPYLYFQGVRFTISGATPGSTSSSAWNYNCLDLSLFRLIDQRPAFTAARAIGALDISGGEVYGATQFYNGITGNLTGNASTATNASKVNNHTVNADVPSNAKFTDTTYESKAAASGGTDVSLVTTGEKYTWNNKLSSHQTIKQDGITGATVNRFGTCSTAADTAAKAVSITTGTFNLEAGARVSVQFSNANTANSPTLNVNSKGAKNIFHKGTQITSGGNKALLAGVVDFIYDGTQWHLIGNYIDTNSNTHRPIQVNGTEILGNNTTALNLKAGNNVSVTNSSGTVTIAATQPKVSIASSAPSSASSGDIWFKIVS